MNERGGAVVRLAAALLVGMVGVGLWDLFSDSPRIWRGAHAIVELTFIALAATTAVVLASGWLRAERSLLDVRGALASHRDERDRWRTLAQNALRGLGDAMDAQFDAWALTPAEKETALLLLKGYSHKDAARLTHRSERTVRQHAVAVYRKSGLGGRAELAAFFFEDMLLPSSERTPPAGMPGT